MVTEQEARDMNTAIRTFLEADSQTIRQQNAADLVIANTWFRNNVTITWRNTQTPREQFNSTVVDVETLLALNETDTFRRDVIGTKLREFRERIRTIKAGL